MRPDPRIDHRIAIVGVSAIMPGAPDVDAFWRNVVEGRDLMTDVPADRWLIEDFYDPDPAAPDKTYARRGAFLPEVEFDPMALGVPPRNLPSTDTAQLLALVAAERLLTGLAGAGLGEVDGERVGVFLGCASLQLLGEMAGRAGRPHWRRAMLDSGLSEADAEAVCDRITSYSAPWQEATFPGLLSNVVAGRIANRFDLRGANFTVDAACASSLAALSVAVDDLLLGRSDLVVTGGVDTLNDPVTFQCFSKTPALSPTGDCRPFDAQADGTMLGEGVALFALKRLDDAERDGDRVHALIRGVGSSSDGGGTSVYAPLDSGQARALRRAYASAGYGPETVGLVEAHGTGTAAGDAAELSALRSVFEGSGRTDRQWCALGSVKSQIGHTKAAAGAAGLLKATLALSHRVLPPTIKVERPNPALELTDSPFHLNTRTRPWIHSADHPRRASVSSFGFGGSNFHVALEEYVSTRPSPRCDARPVELVVLSAATPGELLAHDLSGDLTTVARRGQESFRASHPYRLAVTASSPEDLSAKVEQVRGLVGAEPFSTPSGVHYGVGRPPGRVAFLFPGQGAQYVGMGAELATHFPAAHAVWDRREVSRLVFPPPAFTDAERRDQQGALTDTAAAQPAVAAHSLALLAVLERVGVRPDCVAGHSLGELVALHAARAYDEDTLMRLAARRGELMRTASGVMIALEADADQVTRLLAGPDLDGAWIANHNGPRQVVVAATTEAGGRVCERAAEAGITARPLDTSAAFHSPLVASAVEPLRRYLSELTVHAPLLDVYANATGRVHPVAPDAIRRALADHLAAPVRFDAVVRAMRADGVRVFLEVGPGGALTSLVGQILDDVHAVALDRAGHHGVTGLMDALGRLCALGVPLDLTALWPGPGGPEPVRPAMPVRISGGNLGRRYPPGEETAAFPPAPVLTSPPATDSPGPAASGDTLLAVARAQQEIARAHAAYLSLAEKSVDALRALEGAPSSLPQPAPGTAPLQPAVPSPALPDVPPTPAVEPVPPPVAPRGTDELETVVLAAVAEKTGYPVEILAPHMELEADLGLDSITRTQVLAALRPEFPQLEAVERAQLAPLLTLRTVGEVAERLRALLDAPAPSPAAPSTAAPDRTVRRHVPALRRTPASGTPPRGLGPLVVTDDGAGVAEEVVRLLGERGVHAQVTATDEVALAEATGLLYLGGLAEVDSVDEALAIQRDAFRAARALAPRLRTEGGVFVTVQDTGGGFGLRDARRPWLGGLAALARTVRWEWPSASVKAVDCRRGDRTATEVAAALVDELLGGGPEVDVALDADGTRWTLDLAEGPAPVPGPRTAEGFGPDPVIVVSGGAGAVTSAALREFGSRHPTRFVLLGRGPARGVEGLDRAHYLRVDVRDEGAVRTALAEVRQRWGPITGVVHAAGVLADQRVEDKTEEQFDAVFGTKVEGLRALLAATREDPLKLLCVFSSVVAATGNAGQCDYAMANETLHHVLAAERSARPEAVVRSLLWGPWEGGMVTPELAEVFRFGGVDLIPLPVGARSFAEELTSTAERPQVLLTAGRALARLREVARG
ncbi:SDR family oxidoreductase [Streptomyces sp. NPDC005438]|uniref:type I polyketide synthase n=1 Tax=Streptomyces sp. NPDC005438 TaxID=3156880 RepID=UPI0033B879C7